MEYRFVSVDLQHDFCLPGGKAYRERSCVGFLTGVLFPFLKTQEICIHEIISDYRPPRLGDRGDFCHPGSWGYQSIVPPDLVASQWIKCMNSPTWTRYNIGEPDLRPGLPHSDPVSFESWVIKNIGNSDHVIPVLIGLTVDCCVLCTAQEFNFRGFRPLILREGVDHQTGKPEDRDKILETPMPNWAETIGWEELKPKLIG